MAFITNIDTTVLPYNDDDMKYDIDLRQYVLTPSGYYKFTGVELLSKFDSPSEADAFLIEGSTDIYERMYQLSLLPTVAYKRYKVAKDGDIREDFKRALVYQARYAIRSGGDLLKDQHGVNIEKGKGIDLKMIRGDVSVAPQAISVLQRIGLLYTGFVGNPQFDEDGTF